MKYLYGFYCFLLGSLYLLLRFLHTMKKIFLYETRIFLEGVTIFTAMNRLALNIGWSRDLVDSVQNPGQPPYKLGYRYSGLDKYDGKFSYDSSYFGFKFDVKISTYLKDCKVLAILVVWAIAIALFAVCSTNYIQGGRVFLVSLVVFFPISAF